MAQICDRAAEFISALVAVLVASSFVYYVPVFLKIGVYVCKEVLRKVEFRKDRVLVDLETLDLTK